MKYLEVCKNNFSTSQSPVRLRFPRWNGTVGVLGILRRLLVQKPRAQIVPICAEHLLHKTQKAIFKLGSFQRDVGSEMDLCKSCEELIRRNTPEIVTVSPAWLEPQVVSVHKRYGLQCRFLVTFRRFVSIVKSCIWDAPCDITISQWLVSLLIQVLLLSCLRRTLKTNIYIYIYNTYTMPVWKEV